MLYFPFSSVPDAVRRGFVWFEVPPRRAGRLWPAGLNLWRIKLSARKFLFFDETFFENFY
jgi:hypothetical protein